MFNMHRNGRWDVSLESYRSAIPADLTQTSEEPLGILISRKLFRMRSSIKGFRTSKRCTLTYGRHDNIRFALTSYTQLGGGFEIALSCDIIYASSTAKLGFPEITIGTIPGAGGTQRLTRAIGKQRAMEFILTGAPASALDFEKLGVVNQTFPAEKVLPQALKLAERIAAMSSPIAQLAKQAVLHAEQSHLGAGMATEKSLYYGSFAYEDCKEGMTAFLEKRTPNFQHR
jgi:enoyl-CoA hydratase/carnithine racemase